MQDQDQSQKIGTDENTELVSAHIEANEKRESINEEALAASEAEQAAITSSFSARAKALKQPQHARLDWPALIAALAVAAFFALTARFNSQPSPSYVPAAVFSATGCGLLVTAIHKLRARPGAGLLAAGLGGFGMTLFQFVMTFTYPGVFNTVTTIPDYSRAFFFTWGLIALFAVVLSLAGATIGHLTFAPLRPLPIRAQKQNNTDEDDEDEPEDEDEAQMDTHEPLAHSSATPENKNTPPAQVSRPEAPVVELDSVEVNEEHEASPADEAGGRAEDEEEENEEVPIDEDEEENTPIAATVAQPQHSVLNYAIAVLLLGLLPMMAGYVFAATYDFIMNAINVNTISPALYPTLSLLSGLLPWRIAVPINLSGPNGVFIVFTLLWRIPDSALGNPNLFDVQALETLVFSAAGLALLLITMYRSDTREKGRRSAPIGIFLFLEALLGLILILPANLWLLRGLEGILQFGSIVARLPTMQLLNSTLFILNLATGVLLCPIIGLIVRRQYQLWTAPRMKTSVAPEEELD